jgi:spermidine synthase
MYDKTIINTHRYLLLAVMLGFTSMITQVTLMREFLLVFSGNELIIGILLCNWMVLTAAGTFLGRCFRISKTSVLSTAITVVLSILSIYTLYFTGIIKQLFFEPGVMPGFFSSAILSFVTLTPFCLLSGYSYALFVAILSDQPTTSESGIKIYGYESTGSAIAALVTCLVAFLLPDPFYLLFFTMLINMGLAIAIFITNKNLAACVAICIIGSVITLHFLAGNLQNRRIHNLFPDQTLVKEKNTPYGYLFITKHEGQLNFYENNSLLFSTNNEIQNEEDVHYAMVQHHAPRKLLLIGGGVSGTTNEILKYASIQHIDYIELNPYLTSIGNQFNNSLNNPKIKAINTDARKFLRENNDLYDVILVNLPFPSTIELNRYYTEEFIRLAKRHLTKEGIIQYGLAPTPNYVSNETSKITSVMRSTLSLSFRNILIVPGLKNYMIASDGSLEIHIVKKISNEGISTQYVNSYYLDDNVLEERSHQIMINTNANTTVNKDFMPYSFVAQLNYWLSQYKVNYSALRWSVLPLLLIFFIFRPVPGTIFTIGFTSSSLEIFTIIAVQIFFGQIYQAIGIIFALFMIGLAAGTLIYRRNLGLIRKLNLKRLSLVMASICFLFILFISFSSAKSLNGLIIYGILLVFILAVSFITSLIFSLGLDFKRTNNSGSAAILYSVDLLGSALGAFISAIFLYPLLGLTNSILLLMILNIISVFRNHKN